MNPYFIFTLSLLLFWINATSITSTSISLFLSLFFYFYLYLYFNLLLSASIPISISILFTHLGGWEGTIIFYPNPWNKENVTITMTIRQLSDEVEKRRCGIYVNSSIKNIRNSLFRYVRKYCTHLFWHISDLINILWSKLIWNVRWYIVRWMGSDIITKNKIN